MTLWEETKYVIRGIVIGLLDRGIVGKEWEKIFFERLFSFGIYLLNPSKTFSLTFMLEADKSFGFEFKLGLLIFGIYFGIK